MRNVYFVGKLDLNVFSAVFGNIQTDEVIITEERITHIKQNHPGDFEKYFQYAQLTVEKPDFILEANQPYSAVLLKRIADNGKNFKIIIRFKISSDSPERKNSVITFLHIDEKDWNRLIKNKKVLYKRE